MFFYMSHVWYIYFLKILSYEYNIHTYLLNIYTMWIKKILIKTIDNNPLVSIDFNEWNEAIVDNSVSIDKYDENEIIITLQKEYDNEWKEITVE